MLLRDETQVALNQVETLCLASADDYAAAVNQADDPALASLFAQIANERRALAIELAPHIRALDDLPQQPDPDRETLNHVLTGIKAYFSRNGDATLLENCLRVDAELKQAIESALRDARALHPETRSQLERMLQAVAQSCHTLLQARPPADLE